MTHFDRAHWALILGGSSGFGLASAKKLAAEGLNVCVVHRDRRGAMERVNREFDAIRACGRGFLPLNLDALSTEGIASVLQELAREMGPDGRVRVLLHSIAFGNLRPIARSSGRGTADAAFDRLADALGVARTDVDRAVEQAAEAGEPLWQVLRPVDYGEALLEDEDMARTIYAMGTSLLTWVQRVHAAGLFAADARVLGLTSEGNAVAWRGYAAVAAAKSALESVSRAIAVEFGPLRHPLEHRPAGRHRHARASRDPRQRADEGGRAHAQPARPTHDAGGCRERHLLAVPATRRGGSTAP